MKTKQKEWLKAFSKAYKEFDYKTSIKLADYWAKKAKEKESKVADFSTISLETKKQKEEFVTKSSNGMYYIDAVLSSTRKDTHGDKVSEKVLQEWAEALNNNQFPADIEHEWYNSTAEKVRSGNELKNKISEKEGITDRVKAWVENGVLKVRAWIKEKYKDVVENFNNVSIEAVNTKQVGETIVDSELVGWSFVKSPANKDSKIERIRKL